MANRLLEADSGVTKPGVYTSEFWVAIFGNVLGVLQLTGAWDYLPDSQNKWVLLFLAVLNAAHQVSRGQAKNKVRP
jgi:hypothetical protein